MTDSAHPLAHRFVPAPRRSMTWLLPLLLALALLAAVSAWLQRADARDREDAEQALISQTLSLEKLLRTRIDAEQQRADALALQIAAGRIVPPTFASADEVLAGLRRRWLSITWLDTEGRERAASSALAEGRPPAEDPERRGLSTHIDVSIVGDGGRTAGRLVVRYGLTALLNQETPWWIVRAYEARLVDGFGEVLATTAAPGERAGGAVRRISFDPPFSDVYLELQYREAPQPWYRGLPLAVVGAVLALLGWATWLAWRQNRSVEGAEAAWRGEAAWRRAMEDALTVGLRARDMTGRLLYVNRRFCELTGYTEADLIGRAPPMPYWPADQIDEAMQRHRRNMAGQTPADGYEARWHTRDGRELVVMLFEAPLTDPGGTQIGWLGSVVDVTERRQADERERRRMERAAYQARLMTLGEIAASLAHELNQPLAAIASYGAGVRNALADLPDADARLLAALDSQVEQARRAGRIVERIRAFLDRRAPQQEPCDLGDIVASAVELLRPDLRRRGIALRVEPAPGPVPLEADPVLIEQVIVNLVRNAADAIGAQAASGGAAGGGSIEITCGCEAAAGESWVEVRDDGPGLAGFTVADLSQPFYSTKAEGMGLGLAICRSILEAHRGELQAADRAVGGGAIFRCTLPLRQPACTPTDAPVAAPA